MRWRRASKVPATTSTATEGLPAQLDNHNLEMLVRGIAEHWDGVRARLVIEVGTGGGKGSTVAIHRALTSSGHPFRLLGYEGDADLARDASRYWNDTANVQVVDEYFMRREDVQDAVTARVAPSDRDSYLPEFAALVTRENFLATTPPGPIDLLFVDSVRYTHLAILRAAAPWIRAETVVLMEDDIPEYGELTILESEFALRDVTRHEVEGHPWPFVEFSLAT